MNTLSNRAGFTLIELVIYIFIAFFVCCIMVAPKFLWAWIAPDLFPGAVAQGLVAKTISWGTSLKISAVFFSDVCTII